MSKEIVKSLVSRDGMRSTFQYAIKCIRCGKEHVPQNVYTAKYCPDCALFMKRENGRKRQAAWQQRQREKWL